MITAAELHRVAEKEGLCNVLFYSVIRDLSCIITLNFKFP